MRGVSWFESWRGILGASGRHQVRGGGTDMHLGNICKGFWRGVGEICECLESLGRLGVYQGVSARKLCTISCRLRCCTNRANVAILFEVIRFSQHVQNAFDDKRFRGLASDVAAHHRTTTTKLAAKNSLQNEVSSNEAGDKKRTKMRAMPVTKKLRKC